MQAANVVGDRAAPLPETISSPAKTALVVAVNVVLPRANDLIPRDLPNKLVKAARGRPEIFVKRSAQYLESSSLLLHYYSQLESGLQAGSSCEAESPDADLALFSQESSMKVAAKPSILIVRSHAAKLASNHAVVTAKKRELPVVLLQLVRSMFFKHIN